MKIIKQEYIINAPVKDVWEALTKPSQIKEWSGSNAVMNDREGTSFKLWGGDVFGKNIEVVKNKKLVQEWYYVGKLEEPSILTFNLASEGSKTKVTLIHEKVPQEEFKDIEQGWKDYYILPLKELAEKER